MISYITNIINNVRYFDYIGFIKNIDVSTYLTFEFLLKVVALYAAIIWLSIVIWVAKDIFNRTNNIIFQLICILLALFGTPIFGIGIIVYLLIRPNKTLFEKYYEEDTLIEGDESLIYNQINMQTKKVEKPHNEPINHIDHNNNMQQCPYCSTMVNKGFKFCSSCGEKLKTNCIECGEELDPMWKACPYCGTKQELSQTPDDEKDEVVSNDDLKVEVKDDVKPDKYEEIVEVSSKSMKPDEDEEVEISEKTKKSWIGKRDKIKKDHKRVSRTKSK